MINPLSVATHGLIGLGQYPALEIAVRGYLYVAIVIIVDKGTQPAGAVFPSIFYERDIRKDDQELMELIIIIIKTGMI